MLKKNENYACSVGHSSKNTCKPQMDRGVKIKFKSSDIKSLEWRLKDSVCLDLLWNLHQVRLCLCCNICKMEITLPATYLREP